jgi:superoxide dismutase, Fe-Mn family
MSAENNKSRRKFLADTVKGTAAITIAMAGGSSFLESCTGPKNMVAPTAFLTSYDQQPLPYKYDSLENIIDAKTMEIHYSKHAAGYSKALKEAVQAESVAAGTSVENILSNTSKYSVKMRNNAGGHYNHEMFWQCMHPKIADNKPSGKLLAAIEKTFGSFAAFKTQFADAGKNRFGSGWAWLFLDSSKNLKIGSTANQDNPLMNIGDVKGFPVLCLDVWEHAYYLKYQNKRADYIENWWNVVNWGYAERRFSAV